MHDVITVGSAGSLNQFIDLPWKIWSETGDSENWAPPLRMQVKNILNSKSHPFYRHAQMELFMVRHAGKPVGRIAAILDQNYEKFHGERHAYFGFFECVNDEEACTALVKEAELWAREKGASKLIGPFSPSINYESGLLVEGFDEPSAFMTAYNPPYYDSLLKSCGFIKARDMYAYRYTDKENFKFPQVIEKASKRLLKRGYSVRPMDLKKIQQDMLACIRIGNAATQHHWGFVPIEEDEAAHMASEMKLILDPELAVIIEHKGEVVAFLITLPDINQALIQNKTGRLLPFNWLKLLWNIKGPGRASTITNSRAVALGVKPEYEPLGVGTLIYRAIYRNYMDSNFINSEASWVMEDNHVINSIHRKLGSIVTKTYRLYETSL